MAILSSKLLTDCIGRRTIIHITEWSLHKSSNCYAWKKEAKFINLCVLSSCLLCDDNKRPQMLNRQMTEMNDDLMRGYALFCHCVLAWCTTIRNEWVLWLNLSNAFTHTHKSLQCIQKQQQQLGDRVEFNLPNNRKLKLRLCKTDSIWKLIDSYVNIFFAVISNQCVENLFSA